MADNNQNMDKRFCLLFWFDGERNFSVQNSTTICKPRKDAHMYEKGELVIAKFQGKAYKAVILRVNDSRDNLTTDAQKVEQLLRDADLSPVDILEKMGVSANALQDHPATESTPASKTKTIVPKTQSSKKRKEGSTDERPSKRRKETTAKKSTGGDKADQKQQSLNERDAKAKAAKAACRDIFKISTPEDDDARIATLLEERDQARQRVAELELRVAELEHQVGYRGSARPVATPSKISFLKHMVCYLEEGSSKTSGNRDLPVSHQMPVVLPSTSRRSLLEELEEAPQEYFNLQPLHGSLEDHFNNIHNQPETHPGHHYTSHQLHDTSLAQEAHIHTQPYISDQPRTSAHDQFYSQPHPSQVIQQQNTSISQQQKQTVNSTQLFTPTTQFTQSSCPTLTATHLPQTINDTTVSAVGQEWSSPVTKTGDRKVPLTDKVAVYLTRPQKVALDVAGHNDPKKCIIRILDALFDQRELAGMSALGSRNATNKKGSLTSTAVPKEVKSGIAAYVRENCPTEAAEKALKELNSIINSKCGTARRYL